MKRHAFTLLAILSALCAVATLGCWLRSYAVQPLPARYSDRWLYDAGYAAIYKGGFTFTYYDQNQRPARWFQAVRIAFGPFQIRQSMGASGWNYGWWYTTVDARLWLVCLMFATIPTLRLTLALRRRSSPPGACRRCGYDLRATPNRCPECGAVSTIAK